MHAAGFSPNSSLPGSRSLPWGGLHLRHPGGRRSRKPSAASRARTRERGGLPPVVDMTVGPGAPPRAHRFRCRQFTPTEASRLPRRSAPASAPGPVPCTDSNSGSPTVLPVTATRTCACSRAPVLPRPIFPAAQSSHTSSGAGLFWRVRGRQRRAALKHLVIQWDRGVTGTSQTMSYGSLATIEPGPSGDRPPGKERHTLTTIDLIDQSRSESIGFSCKL